MSLREIFNQEAADVAGVFAERGQNFVVVDKEGDYIYLSADRPDDAKLLAQNLLKNFRQSADVGGMACRYVSRIWGIGDPDMRDTNVIAVDFAPFIALAEMPANETALGAPSDVMKAFYPYYVFDHEMGHILTDNGTGSFQKDLHESVADAYALLRFIQRSPDPASWPAFISEVEGGKMAYMLERSEDIEAYTHYTVPVFRAVLDLAARFDIGSLTRAETADVADLMGLNYTRSIDRETRAEIQVFANKIKQTALSLIKVQDYVVLENLLADVARTMTETKSPEALRIYGSFLKPLGGLRMLETLAENGMDSLKPYLADIRKAESAIEMDPAKAIEKEKGFTVLQIAHTVRPPAQSQSRNGAQLKA